VVLPQPHIDRDDDVARARFQCSNPVLRSIVSTIPALPGVGIVRARRLGQAMMRNIGQNLFFAFIHNVVEASIAGGVLYPIFGSTQPHDRECGDGRQFRFCDRQRIAAQKGSVVKNVDAVAKIERGSLDCTTSAQFTPSILLHPCEIWIRSTEAPSSSEGASDSTQA
jgi:hypothetical protein